jgi:hypothetical protein
MWLLESETTHCRPINLKLRTAKRDLMFAGTTYILHGQEQDEKLLCSLLFVEI